MRRSPFKLSIAACTLAIGLFAFLICAGAIGTPAPPSGEQIYARRCASCHGPKGEGSAARKKLLTGDKSVGELAPFIRKSMPPGASQKLSAEEAQAVASYIYGAFYSPLAQERNRPARVALSRLTVRQYRNALADLIGSFRTEFKPDDRRGLHAEYFKAGRLRPADRVIERVDPQVKFDFGTNGALPEQNDPYQYAMRWEGSVLAPDNGEYEFIVKTDQAARLWVNDLKRPLIDVYVKSGSENEYRSSLTLLGGRPYPIRLEFSKGVNGVDDLSKLKKKPPQPAFLSLEWRQPKRAPEPIPQRCLYPVLSPEVYATVTPFPPDDRSIGYERGNAVSKAWDDAVEEASMETARYVLEHVEELAGVRPTDRRPSGDTGDPAAHIPNGQKANPLSDQRAIKLHSFCKQFVERAFRRPLSPELEEKYVTRQLQKAPDPETGLKRVVILALNSPRFLYRELDSGKPDQYDIASRLSFTLWDSLPDAELMRAAATNQLATQEQIAKQAQRMIADARAWFKLREFFHQWFKVDSYPDLAKDPKKYPNFDLSVQSDLRTSFDMFLENTLRSDPSDFKQLWLADKVYMNGRLAKLYDVNLPAETPFEQVSLDPQERAGVLTHPYLMASFSYLDSSSPIHRGVLLARNVLGRALQPPPQAFVPLPASLHPNMTTRQRVTMQTQPPACKGCHGMINPLGFTLEKFDAIGKLRAVENGQPVDATGSYQTRDGKIVKFNGVRDLAQYLATSPEAHQAFVEKLFQYMVKQPVRAYGPQALTSLTARFDQDQTNVRKLMLAITTEAALRG